MTHAIKNMWRIFPVKSDVTLEIRAIWPKGIPGNKPPIVRHLRAGDYGNVEDLKTAFEEQALVLNRAGYNIYTTLNPIRPDFMGAGGAKDSDIRCRDLLLIDIDRVGNTSFPADQNELDAARSLADSIRRYTARCGWPDPWVVMSGNGYHLYYPLREAPNNDATTDLVATTLRNLASAFDNNVVGVDTTVYNASRITKVPGTLMRKGQATDDRPYRVAVVCDEE
jgi:hypothetical protein